MEAKKAMVLFLMILVALASFFASPSTARDPSLGLPVGGKRASRSLECCNDCRCEQSYCVCVDEMESECYNGCDDCRCDYWKRPPCRCADMLGYCPERCGLQSGGSHAHASPSTPSMMLQPGST